VLAAEIARYLSDQGIGTFNEAGPGGDIFVPLLPDTPEQAVAVRPTGGYQADGKDPYDKPTVQVYVRGTTDARTGASKAQAIYDLLHGFHAMHFVSNGIFIVNCVGIQSGPAHVGRDENGRHEFSMNFELYILNESRRT
jgi:hypothetical protein